MGDGEMGGGEMREMEGRWGHDGRWGRWGHLQQSLDESGHAGGVLIALETLVEQIEEEGMFAGRTQLRRQQLVVERAVEASGRLGQHRGLGGGGDDEAMMKR